MGLIHNGIFMVKLRNGANVKFDESEDYQTGSWRKEIPVVLKRDVLDNNPEIGLFCPEAAIIYKDSKFSHIDYRYCKGCGICAQHLKDAIIMKKM